MMLSKKKYQLKNTTDQDLKSKLQKQVEVLEKELMNITNKKVEESAEKYGRDSFILE